MVKAITDKIDYLSKYSAGTRLGINFVLIWIRYGLFGKYYLSGGFFNADLMVNEDRHCYVVDEYDEPLPEEITGATDVTKQMVNWFRMSFYFCFICFWILTVLAIMKCKKQQKFDLEKKKVPAEERDEKKYEHLKGDFPSGIKEMRTDMMVCFIMELFQFCLLLAGTRIYRSYGGQVCSGNYGRVMGGDYMLQSGMVMHKMLVFFYVWTSMKLCCWCCGLWTLKGLDKIESTLKTADGNAPFGNS
jgi:hypothetical protein